MEKSEYFYYLLYILLNFLCYFLVIFSQIKSITSISVSFHLLQILSSFFSLLFLKITRNKPGYMSKDKIFDKIEKKENKKETIIIFESSPIININLMPNNGCKICQITKLPLRSHHCHKCKKCVQTFDHHCWILAGCIGENNRFKLIIYLIFQNFSIIMSALGILKIMNNQNNEILTYTLTLLFSVICLFLIIFFWVFIYHIYLLITNQTTFELFNEDKCPYLLIFSLERKKILSQRGINVNDDIRYKPFDSGIIKNIVLYFQKMINNKSPIKWDKIYFDNLKSNHVKVKQDDKNISKLKFIETQ